MGKNVWVFRDPNSKKRKLLCCMVFILIESTALIDCRKSMALILKKVCSFLQDVLITYKEWYNREICEAQQSLRLCYISCFQHQHQSIQQTFTFDIKTERHKSFGKHENAQNFSLYKLMVNVSYYCTIFYTSPQIV